MNLDDFASFKSLDPQTMVAEIEVLPEADTHTLAGMLNPLEVLHRTVSIFLGTPSDHPRHWLRLELTQQGISWKA